MKLWAKFVPGERGQTLVWVAGGLAVLMIILAFAIDIGTLQGERRHMQNAADAAALEAARARCFDPGVTSGAQAAALGQAFAVANYTNRPFAVTEAFTVTARIGNDWEFDAYATERVRLTFAGLFTSGQVNVTTHAAAACGGSPYACGLFPLAFSESIWNGIKNMCGQEFYVWTSDFDQNNPSGQPTPIPPDCHTRCDCSKVYDKKDNLIPGAIAIAETGRAWLDFTSAASPLNPIDCGGGSNGCGKNELSCWIKSDSQVLLLKDTCVSGTNGLKWGAADDVNDRAGDFVNIPLFNGPCGTGRDTGDCDATGFNISGFGCVQVIGIDKNEKYSIGWKMVPTPNAQGKVPQYCNDKADKMMRVAVGCGQCETTCGKASSGGNPGSGIKAVSLID